MVDRKQQYESLLHSKKFRRRAFYVLIFMLAAITVYDVTNLTLEYIKNPTKADMNMNFNESMTFPNLTFCMMKEHAWSHFGVNARDKAQLEKVEQWGPSLEKELANMTDRSAMVKAEWSPELTMSAYQAIARLNEMERESVPQKAIHDIIAFGKQAKKARQRRLVKGWLQAIGERNVTFREFSSKTGLELLRRSLQRFQRISYNESDQFVPFIKPQITWISDKHICFQPLFPDQENFKDIEDQGNFLTMMLKHDPKLKSTSCKYFVSVDFHGRPTTMARNMEGKGRVKDGTNEELCIGQNHELTVEIRAHYKMLENDNKATACRLYDDEESDTEFDCRSRCRMEMIRKLCKCTPLTLQYLSDEKALEMYPQCDYEKCELSENVNATDQVCAQKCVPHCVQIRYNLNLDQRGKSVDKNSKEMPLTTIKLIWGAFEYLELEQNYTWTPWTFIAAVGGSIGMWLGLSILSLIQLVTFLTERTAKVVVTDKKRDKVSVSKQPAEGPPQYSPRSPNPNPNYPAGEGPAKGRDKRDPSASMNPFGGPVAVNIFESPFPKESAQKAAPIGGAQTQLQHRGPPYQ